jgi:hypothetical protein
MLAKIAAAVLMAAMLVPLPALAETPFTWTEVATVDDGPPQPTAAMTYDAARKRVLLFVGVGNVSGKPIEPQTWTWDGSARKWSKLDPPQMPPGRRQHVLTYDPARERVVLFGGRDNQGTAFQDTWEWDGTTWTEVMPAGTIPPYRQEQAFTFDGASGRSLMFGGLIAGKESLNDLWEWDGSAWAEVMPASMLPGKVRGHAMTYDAARKEVVVFGGTLGSYSFSQATSLWDGGSKSWTFPSAGTGPSMRTGAAMTYDEARQRVVLFGGEFADGDTYERTDFDDTWEWDGSVWVEASPAGKPPGRQGAAIAYDAAHSEVVMLGGSASKGSLGGTWGYGPGSGAGAGGAGGSGGTGGGETGGSAPGDAGDNGGCGCRISGQSGRQAPVFAAIVALALLSIGRKRRM